MERSFQAIPAGSDLIERARSDLEVGELLSLARFYFQRGLAPDVGPTPPAAAELREIIRGLIAAEPALATRNFYVDRRWDQLRYLLSATYRGAPAGPSDALLEVAIVGEAEVADNVCGGQGYPARYTSPGKVADVARALGSLDVSSLRRHYDLAVMEAQGVYKAFAGRETPEDWAYLSGLIEGLRAFYLEAARCGDGVLVCTD